MACAGSGSSTPFSADYASIQLRELGAADTPEMRSELKARKRWLSKKTNVRKLLALSDSFAVPQELGSFQVEEVARK